MQESTNREKVLKKIRKALIHKTLNPNPNIDFDSNVFEFPQEPLELVFAHSFNAVGGQFVFCEDEADFINNFTALASQKKWTSFFCREERMQKFLLQCNLAYKTSFEAIAEMPASLTGCEALLARTGSILVSSRQGSGRRAFAYPPVHLVVAYTSQLVPDIKDGLNLIKARYGTQLPSQITVITGPSKTSDIESTTIIGAQGPVELFVFLVDDQS